MVGASVGLGRGVVSASVGLGEVWLVLQRAWGEVWIVLEWAWGERCGQCFGRSGLKARGLQRGVVSASVGLGREVWSVLRSVGA